MGRSAKRRRTAAAVTDRVFIEKLGPKGFQLLQRRLTGARLAFETLAAIAPEVLATFGRREPDWQARVPPDVIDLFEALFQRFDRSNICACSRIDRKRLLTLIKGSAVSGGTP